MAGVEGLRRDGAGGGADADIATGPRRSAGRPTDARDVHVADHAERLRRRPSCRPPGDRALLPAEQLLPAAAAAQLRHRIDGRPLAASDRRARGTVHQCLQRGAGSIAPSSRGGAARPCRVGRQFRTAPPVDRGHGRGHPDRRSQLVLRLCQSSRCSAEPAHRGRSGRPAGDGLLPRHRTHAAVRVAAVGHGLAHTTADRTGVPLPRRHERLFRALHRAGSERRPDPIRRRHRTSHRRGGDATGRTAFQRVVRVRARRHRHRRPREPRRRCQPRPVPDARLRPRRAGRVQHVALHRRANGRYIDRARPEAGTDSRSRDDPPRWNGVRRRGRLGDDARRQPDGRDPRRRLHRARPRRARGRRGRTRRGRFAAGRDLRSNPRGRGAATVRCAAERDLQQRQLLQHRDRRAGGDPDLQRRRGADARIRRGGGGRPDHAGRHLRPERSDRACAVAQHRTRHADRTGIRSARLQGVARHRGHLRAQLHPQGRQPLPRSRVGHGAARCAGTHHRLPADRHRQHCPPAGRGRAQEARPARTGPALLHALADRIEHRRADGDRPARHHHRRQQAGRGIDRLHARRADRRAVLQLLHRSPAGRGRHQARARRDPRDELRADREVPRRQADQRVVQRHHLPRPRPAPAGHLRRGPRHHRSQAVRGLAARSDP